MVDINTVPGSTPSKQEAGWDHPKSYFACRATKASSANSSIWLPGATCPSGLLAATPPSQHTTPPSLTTALLQSVNAHVHKGGWTSKLQVVPSLHAFFYVCHAPIKGLASSWGSYSYSLLHVLQVHFLSVCPFLDGSGFVRRASLMMTHHSHIPFIALDHDVSCCGLLGPCGSCSYGWWVYREDEIMFVSMEIKFTRKKSAPPCFSNAK
jgi:hypothetical protein